MGESLWKRQAAWAALLASQHRLCEPDFRREALEFAREMMRIARRNVLALIDRVAQQGYRFAEPDAVYVPPRDDPGQLLDALEDQEIFVPIALRAWMEEVGEVRLIGTHPEWKNPGFNFAEAPRPKQIWCTDPLYVGVWVDWIKACFEQWQCRCQRDGLSYTGPFCIDVAPDEFHKANLSGGDSYKIQANRPAVDAVLLNERHCFTFVAYLRHCFNWGGFPGFELIDERPTQFLDQLRDGLEGF
jgi:hypothetical protein